MSAHDLHAIAVPSWTRPHIAALGRFCLTTFEKYGNGEKLLEAGACDFKFFVVKSGKFEIMDESDETPKSFAVHGRGSSRAMWPTDAQSLAR
jgi:hypothetical protein